MFWRKFISCLQILIFLQNICCSHCSFSSDAHFYPSRIWFYISLLLQESCKWSTPWIETWFLSRKKSYNASISISEDWVSLKSVVVFPSVPQQRRNSTLVSPFIQWHWSLQNILGVFYHNIICSTFKFISKICSQICSFCPPPFVFYSIRQIKRCEKNMLESVSLFSTFMKPPDYTQSSPESSLQFTTRSECAECAHRSETQDFSRDARDCHVLRTHMQAGGFDRR